MSRTSKRWWLRVALGIAGAATVGDQAMAEGWLRGRLRSLCDGPLAPWTQPATQGISPLAPTPETVAPPVATEPASPPSPMPMIPTAPPAPPGVAPPAPAEPRFEPLVSAALGEGAVAVAFHPAMFGDQTSGGSVIPPITGVPPVTVPGGSTTVPGGPTTVPGGSTTTPTTPTNPANTNNPARPRPAIVRFPIVSYAAFKIAENESPRPTDRIYATYSYFNNVPTGTSSPNFDVHRETIGFEKTLLDGRASVGVRVPFLQLDGPSSFFNSIGANQGQIGDLTVITKYAFYDDRSTSNLISGGLAITAPTGEDFQLANNQSIHCWLLQPWMGGIWNAGDFFVHGFSSVVVPTDSRDVTAWYNDFGVGYWLRREQRQYVFHGIIPTAEVHVGTSFNGRDYNDVNSVYMANFVTLLGGANFVFARNSTLGFAAGAPVTGPRPWQFESHVSINFRF